MNKPHARFWHSLVRALGLAWTALLLAACGAGTGGTGSGPPAASADASLKPGDTASPSSRPAFLGTWIAGDLTAAIGENTLVVTQGCATFEFSGDWSIDSLQQIQVQGTFTGCPPQNVPVVANLVAQQEPPLPGAATQSLSVLITDAVGQVLLYQTLLIRSPQATTTPPGTEITRTRSK